MQSVQISLVIGKKGSGVSTLLAAFAKRADMQGTLIVDEGDDEDSLPEAWGSDQIAPWLRHLRDKGEERIVLAASDLRAPRHLLQALADEPALGASFRLAAVTSVIDAANAPSGAEGTGPQGADRAAAVADRIILTKTDQARPETVKRLASALKALNPPAPILRAQNGDIGPARLVDSGLFDPITGSVDIDRWLCEAAFNFEASRRGVGVSKQGEIASTLGRSAVGFFAIAIDQPINNTVLSVFLKLLMADRGADLLRLKGIVATDDHPDRPALIDGREHIIQPLLWLPAWPTTDHRSRLVFVTSAFSETWIRTLLTTLSDQLDLAEPPALRWALVEEAAGDARKFVQIS